MGLMVICMSFLVMCVFKLLAQLFKNWSLCFLIDDFLRVLCMFWIQIFVNMCIEDTVSNTLACPFSLLKVFFYQTIAETFLNSSYTFYYLGAFILLTDALLRFFFFLLEDFPTSVVIIGTLVTQTQLIRLGIQTPSRLSLSTFISMCQFCFLKPVFCL